MQNNVDYDDYEPICIREHLLKQKPFLSGIAKNGRQKQRLACITEPSNDDYDNHVSDSCDHNFGTFDDLCVKNDQKVSHNMTLMSKYKGQHGGKKGQQIRAGVSPPPFRAMPERKHFFFRRASLNATRDNFRQKCVNHF